MFVVILNFCDRVICSYCVISVFCIRIIFGSKGSFSRSRSIINFINVFSTFRRLEW